VTTTSINVFTSHILPFSRRIELSILCVLVAFCGCGDGRPTRVPVSGVVLIDGQPLSRGNIKFVPEQGRPSAGKIDQDGRFTLTCYDGSDGAILGKHRIQIAANRGIRYINIEFFDTS
jgi:hypothetical protein